MTTNDKNYRAVAAALGAEIPFRLMFAREVQEIHDAMIGDFGGTPGVRDIGMLESAVARQLQTATYGECSIAALTASLAFGIAQNHAFLDGNKRTAFGAMIAFIDKNNATLNYDPVEAHQVFVELAAGNVSEVELYRWIDDLLKPQLTNKPASMR